MMNQDLTKLKSFGFGVEVKSSSNGWSLLYLTCAGALMSRRVAFRSNKKSRGYLQSMTETARPNTHLGRAIRELLDEFLADNPV